MLKHKRTPLIETSDGICWDLFETELGWAAIAVNGVGVVSLQLADDAVDASTALQARLSPGASRFIEGRQTDQQTKILVAAVDFVRTYAQDPATANPSQIPLDVNGSPLQEQVWDALCQTRIGETLSYQGLAQQLGRPKAHRAIANAVASNPIALLVPCHRVIRSDGSLGGYRWGIERKAALLEHEQLAVKELVMTGNS